MEYFHQTLQFWSQSININGGTGGEAKWELACKRKFVECHSLPSLRRRRKSLK